MVPKYSDFKIGIWRNQNSCRDCQELLNLYFIFFSIYNDLILRYKYSAPIYVIHRQRFGPNEELYYRRGMLGFYGIHERVDVDGNTLSVLEDDFPINFFTLCDGIKSSRPGHQLDELYRLKSFQLVLSELIQNELKATRGVKTFYLRMRARHEDVLSLVEAARDYCAKNACGGFTQRPTEGNSRTRISIQGRMQYINLPYLQFDKQILGRK